eukprot:CFRG0902T1
MMGITLPEGKGHPLDTPFSSFVSPSGSPFRTKIRNNALRNESMNEKYEDRNSTNASANETHPVKCSRRTSGDINSPTLNADARSCYKPRPVFGVEAMSHKKSYSSTNRSSATPASSVAPKHLSKQATPRYKVASRVFYDDIASTPAGPQPVEAGPNAACLKSPFYDNEKPGSYFEQAFAITEKLGEGSFGQVFKARCKKNGRLYAIKRSYRRFNGSSDRLRQIEEANHVRNLGNHSHCIRYFDAWQEDGLLHLQTELCERGTLQQYLEHTPDVPEEQVWVMITDLALGLQHIHSHNLIHLDLKPANVFLTESGSLKIGDFGIAIDSTKAGLGDIREGDPKYMAPELLNHCEVIDNKVDIFSLGILALEIVDNVDLPSNGPIWLKLRSGCIPRLGHVSPSLLRLITLMMHPDPKGRPTSDELLSHTEICAEINSRHSTRTRIKKLINLRLFFTTAWSALVALYYALEMFLSLSYTESKKVMNGAFGISSTSITDLQLTPLGQSWRTPIYSSVHSNVLHRTQSRTQSGTEMPSTVSASSYFSPQSHACSKIRSGNNGSGGSHRKRASESIEMRRSGCDSGSTGQHMPRQNRSPTRFHRTQDVDENDRSLGCYGRQNQEHRMQSDIIHTTPVFTHHYNHMHNQHHNSPDHIDANTKMNSKSAMNMDLMSANTSNASYERFTAGRMRGSQDEQRDEERGGFNLRQQLRFHHQPIELPQKQPQSLRTDTSSITNTNNMNNINTRSTNSIRKFGTNTRVLQQVLGSKESAESTMKILQDSLSMNCITNNTSMNMGENSDGVSHGHNQCGMMEGMTYGGKRVGADDEPDTPFRTTTTTTTITTTTVRRCMCRGASVNSGCDLECAIAKDIDTNTTVISPLSTAIDSVDRCTGTGAVPMRDRIGERDFYTPFAHHNTSTNHTLSFGSLSSLRQSQEQTRQARSRRPLVSPARKTQNSHSSDTKRSKSLSLTQAQTQAHALHEPQEVPVQTHRKDMDNFTGVASDSFLSHNSVDVSVGVSVNTGPIVTPSRRLGFGSRRTTRIRPTPGDLSEDGYFTSDEMTPEDDGPKPMNILKMLTHEDEN